MTFILKCDIDLYRHIYYEINLYSCIYLPILILNSILHAKLI